MKKLLKTTKINQIRKASFLNLESYQRAYPHVLKLSMLQEVEIVSKTLDLSLNKNSINSIHSPNSSSQENRKFWDKFGGLKLNYIIRDLPYIILLILYFLIFFSFFLFFLAL